MTRGVKVISKNRSVEYCLYTHMNLVVSYVKNITKLLLDYLNFSYSLQIIKDRVRNILKILQDRLYVRER